MFVFYDLIHMHESRTTKNCDSVGSEPPSKLGHFHQKNYQNLSRFSTQHPICAQFRDVVKQLKETSRRCKRDEQIFSHQCSTYINIQQFFQHAQLHTINLARLEATLMSRRRKPPL